MVCIGFSNKLPNPHGASEHRFVNHLNRNLGLLVNGGSDLLGLLFYLTQSFFAIQLLTARDKPDFKLLEINVHV